MELLTKLRILDKSNELIKSIARGSEPTVRCSPKSSKDSSKKLLCSWAKVPKMIQDLECFLSVG